VSQKDVSRMADVVLGWLRDLPRDVEEEFAAVAEDRLHQYHHSLGRQIRNHFQLWNISWEPELVEGVDVSNEHPDAISMEVIREVWRRVQ